MSVEEVRSPHSSLSHYPSTYGYVSRYDSLRASLKPSRAAFQLPDTHLTNPDASIFVNPPVGTELF